MIESNQNMKHDHRLVACWCDILSTYPVIRRNHTDLPHTLRAVESLIYRGNVVSAGPVWWLSQPMRRRGLRRSVLCSLLTSVVFNIRTDGPTYDSLVSDMSGSLFGSSMFGQSFLNLSSLFTISAICRGGATIRRRTMQEEHYKQVL